MAGRTILNVGGSDRRLDCAFSRRGTGARHWQTIVDHFLVAARIAAALLGKRAILPRGSRSAGRGSSCGMSLPVYLAARVMWEAHPMVSAALGDGSLAVNDEHAVPRFALEVARVHHDSLGKAMRAELIGAEEIDTVEDGGGVAERRRAGLTGSL